MRQELEQVTPGHACRQLYWQTFYQEPYTSMPTPFMRHSAEVWLCVPRPQPCRHRRESRGRWIRWWKANDAGTDFQVRQCKKVVFRFSTLSLLENRTIRDSIETGDSRIVELSVVVPCYNEESVLGELHRRLTATIEPLDIDAEVILVNDGSRDGTWSSMLELAATGPAVGSGEPLAQPRPPARPDGRTEPGERAGAS